MEPVDFHEAATKIVPATVTKETDKPWTPVYSPPLAEARIDEKASRANKIAKLRWSLGKRYADCGFSNYQIYHMGQTPVFDRLNKLCVPLAVGEGRNIVLFGSVGTGKDHLLAALLLQAAEDGAECEFVNGMEMYARLRDRMKDDAREADFLRSLSGPTVLGISDPTPPIGELNAWRTEFLYRVIDARYRAMKSTWIAMNATSAKDAEQQLGARLWDRLQECSEVIPCFWPSWRERKKQWLKMRREEKTRVSHESH